MTYSIVGCNLEAGQWGVGVQSKFLAVGSVVPWAEPHAGAGGRTGDCYAAQGNILVSEATVGALAETFEATKGAPLAERLLAALDAAQAAGGDSRGQQSAAVLVVERDGGYAGLSDVLLDLRVDDHERPLDELRRLYGLQLSIREEVASR